MRSFDVLGSYYSLSDQWHNGPQPPFSKDFHPSPVTCLPQLLSQTEGKRALGLRCRSDVAGVTVRGFERAMAGWESKRLEQHPEEFVWGTFMYILHILLPPLSPWWANDLGRMDPVVFGGWWCVSRMFLFTRVCRLKHCIVSTTKNYKFLPCKVQAPPGLEVWQGKLCEFNSWLCWRTTTNTQQPQQPTNN